MGTQQEEIQKFSSEEITVLMIITLLISNRYCGSEKDSLNERLERFSLEDEDITSDEFLDALDSLVVRGVLNKKIDENIIGTLGYELEAGKIDIPANIEYELTIKGKLITKLLILYIDKEDIKVEKITNGAITVYKCTVSITKKIIKVLDKIGIGKVIEKILTEKVSK